MLKPAIVNCLMSSDSGEICRPTVAELCQAKLSRARLSFSPRTHEHYSQEMLGVTGNLDENLFKIILLIKPLQVSTKYCLIPLNKAII
jgi:hypothetical protein